MAAHSNGSFHWQYFDLNDLQVRPGLHQGITSIVAHGEERYTWHWLSNFDWKVYSSMCLKLLTTWILKKHADIFRSTCSTLSLTVSAKLEYYQFLLHVIVQELLTNVYTACLVRCSLGSLTSRLILIYHINSRTVVDDALLFHLPPSIGRWFHHRNRLRINKITVRQRFFLSSSLSLSVYTSLFCSRSVRSSGPRWAARIQCGGQWQF